MIRIAFIFYSKTFPIDCFTKFCFTHQMCMWRDIFIQFFLFSSPMSNSKTRFTFFYFRHNDYLDALDGDISSSSFSSLSTVDSTYMVTWKSGYYVQIVSALDFLVSNKARRYP